MSQTPISSGPSTPPPQRDGCLVFALVLVGAVLLLPGICALFFVGTDPKGMLTDSTGLGLVILCLAVAAGGVALIWMALRRPTRPNAPPRDPTP
jgi:uncharacterized membrane-anchored protein